ncbi:Cholesterol 7-alpha-monooxygenase [Lecanosticta acicola]|uniref:Cholesterol 7-alpha-monooxygenase n=1 Tax=Lecanosticta acicola TaxID=111012 RepID=A0AAI8YSU8_9PEZI|nr:Cholesterol 7-alpha-monooxygenase [Lecanosticta acicola]
MDVSINTLLDNTHLQDLKQYPYAITFILLSATILLTRLVSTLTSASKKVHNGAKTPPSVPYWIPLLGHIPNMALDADGFVKSLRAIYTEGIFTLNFGGSRHNIMFTLGLATAMLNQKSTNADNEGVSKRLMRLNFGFPAEELDKYDAALDELLAAYKHIQVDPWLGDMVHQTARKARENVSNLVTFMESPVDQTPWEKVSNVKVIEGPDGEQVVEASLLPLIRDFCAFTANPSIMGSDFLENNPQFFDDIWTLDRGFLLLATGLPRWAPIPVLTRAHIARRNNLQRLDDFHNVLDQHWNGEKVDAKWSSLDDIGGLLKARMEIYRKYDFSIRARASVEHALMWAANANSNALVFWMINRIYEDRALVAMIREEIAPYVEVQQQETGLPISEPPRITKFDVEGLCNNCPLLKSCYVECLRVDTGSWSFKTIRQDFMLQSREKDAQAWLLRKGDYAHVAHDLHNTDPTYWNDPMVWRADRHIKYDDKKRGTTDMGSIRPYGGGSSMCKGRAFAFKEAMIFSATLISIWDIEPRGRGAWKMPKHRKATGVFGTDDDTRVWLKRRKIPSTS